MRRKIRKLKDNQAGAVLLEMCLSLFILTMILLGIVQIGITFAEWNLISFAAREGARYGAETNSTVNAMERAESLIKSNKGMEEFDELDPTIYTISAYSSAGSRNLTVSILWESDLFGFDIESTKTFKIAS